MPLRSAIMVLLLVTFPNTGSRAEDPTASGEWLNWTGTNRKTVRARFVEMSVDKREVVLELEQGGRATVPLERLDPASQRQALQEADQMADQPISAVREMVFVEIPRGRFKMGSPPDEPGRVTNGQTLETVVPPAAQAASQAVNPADLEEPADFEPERRVDITKPFWMKQTEVMWREWNAVRARAKENEYHDIGPGRNGSDGDDSGTHPVTDITWWDAVKWCNLKSQIEGRQIVYHTTRNFNGSAVFKTGTQEPVVNWKADGYRLPTEAEWEYACREGRSTSSKPYHAELGQIAWYVENSNGNTHPVGTTKGRAHQFGLKDMHGNVAEWCWDWAGLLVPGDIKDPRGNEKGLVRVFRGGSWADPARCCRAAYRATFSPVAPASRLVGFRPVCGADPAKRPTTR